MILALAVWGLAAAAAMIADRLGLAGWAAGLLLALLALAAVVGIAGMFGAARRFTTPLGAVIDAADRVAGGDYGVRVAESGPPPMRALTSSFNTMTERLQRADRVRRDLMADVAHELRTPLTVLQGRLEGLVDGVYPRDVEHLTQLLEETRVLSRLVEDLRTLALSEAAALPLQFEATDITQLVRDSVESLRTEAAGARVTVTVASATRPEQVELDPVRIREVLTNLLLNALHHSGGRGGAVTVRLSENPENVTVTVEDTGEGMPPDEAARIFDRFYKGSESRGSGLGLTIAKGIVTAHGGDIHASSRPGEGTTVTFTLPKRRDDEA